MEELNVSRNATLQEQTVPENENHSSQQSAPAANMHMPSDDSLGAADVDLDQLWPEDSNNGQTIVGQRVATEENTSGVMSLPEPGASTAAARACSSVTVDPCSRDYLPEVQQIRNSEAVAVVESLLDEAVSTASDLGERSAEASVDFGNNTSMPKRQKLTGNDGLSPSLGEYGQYLQQNVLPTIDMEGNITDREIGDEVTSIATSRSNESNTTPEQQESVPSSSTNLIRVIVLAGATTQPNYLTEADVDQFKEKIFPVLEQARGQMSRKTFDTQKTLISELGVTAFRAMFSDSEIISTRVKKKKELASIKLSILSRYLAFLFSTNDITWAAFKAFALSKEEGFRLTEEDYKYFCDQVTKYYTAKIKTLMELIE